MDRGLLQHKQKNIKNINTNSNMEKHQHQHQQKTHQHQQKINNIKTSTPTTTWKNINTNISKRQININIKTSTSTVPNANALKWTSNWFKHQLLEKFVSTREGTKSPITTYTATSSSVRTQVLFRNFFPIFLFLFTLLFPFVCCAWVKGPIGR